MGARPTKDGIDCIFTDTSNAMNVPNEVVESTAPLRVNYLRIRRDSGGAGRWRGGCGYEKEYQCLTERTIVSHRGERHFTQPWGLAGGHPGASARSVVVRADGTEEVVPSKKTIELRRNDRLKLWTSGGGGYGDPLERPPEDVAADVLDGKVGIEAAERCYGVVMEAGRLSPEASREMRTRMRAETVGWWPAGHAGMSEDTSPETAGPSWRSVKARDGVWNSLTDHGCARP